MMAITTISPCPPGRNDRNISKFGASPNPEIAKKNIALMIARPRL